MLQRLLGRWRNRAAPANPARDVPVVPLPAGEPMRPIPQAPPMLLRPEDRDADFEMMAQAELALRLGALDEAVPAAGNEAAVARALLEDLRGELKVVIRKPPLAAQEALAAVRSPNADVTRLVRIFERDPALAPPLLRRANSAYYNVGQNCVALGDAVQRIGTEGVHGVLVGSIVEGLLCRPGAPYDAMVEQVWQHMIRTAPLARQLAPAFGLAAEPCFTLALLHDVGKLVIFDWMTQRRHQRREAIHFPPGFLAQALRRLHEPLGALVCLAWGLGTSAARAVGTHHREPLRYAGEPYSELLCVAERVDLAAVRDLRVDLPALWRDADIAAPMAPVMGALTSESAA